MPFHKDLDLEEIHQIHTLEYADRVAREAATFATADIGKVVKQTDEGSYWIVLSTTPTFTKINAGEGVKTTTTDDTATVIWSFTLTDNSAIGVSARVIAMQTDGSSRNYYWISGLFYKDGGSATQQGSTASLVGIESESAASLAFTVSGDEVRVTWTGVAGEDWVVTPRVEYEIIK